MGGRNHDQVLPIEGDKGCCLRLFSLALVARESDDGVCVAVAGMKEDKHVTFLPAYGAEVRGGTANCTVVISDQEIASPIAIFSGICGRDELSVHDEVPKYGQIRGVMFLNSDLISESPARSDLKTVQVPANSLAHEMGNDRALNMIMLGAVVKITGIVSDKALAEAVGAVMEGKKQALIDANRKALEKGFSLHLFQESEINPFFDPDIIAVLAIGRGRSGGLDENRSRDLGKA